MATHTSKDDATSPGVLYVVATPIGNLDDISARALRVLKEVDIVAAEDTRVTGRMLGHFGIRAKLISVHDHNERDRARGVIDSVLAGQSVALVSDAGTPLISDPGFILVRDAAAAGVRIEPVPGPSAVTAALSVSGIAADRFAFEGFLSAKRTARKTQLAALAGETRTLVFYEAPRRILSTLEDMGEIFGATRNVVVARELTKRFETLYRGDLASVLATIVEASDEQRGEFVVVVAGVDEAPEVATVDDETFRILLQSMSVKAATDVVCRITGARRNAVYQRALELNR